MDKNNITKEYSNGEITVVWQSAKCKHSAKCTQKLTTVFEPPKALQHKVENSDSDELIKTVTRCPSGALSYRLNS